MAKHQRKPREGCFVPQTGGTSVPYVMTDIGIAHVAQMAALGCSIGEIAQYLRVSGSWLRETLDIEHDNFRQDIADAFDEGTTEFKKRIREHQYNLAETNAQMAIHLGKHHLGQKDDALEVNHNVKIVGTLPDYGSTPDDWRRQFAPSVLQSVEPPKQGKQPVVIEAEVLKE